MECVLKCTGGVFFILQVGPEVLTLVRLSEQTRPVCAGENRPTDVIMVVMAPEQKNKTKNTRRKPDLIQVEVKVDGLQV